MRGRGKVSREGGSSLAPGRHWPLQSGEAHHMLGKTSGQIKRNGSVNPQQKWCVICLKTLKRNLGNLLKGY